MLVSSVKKIKIKKHFLVHLKYLFCSKYAHSIANFFAFCYLNYLKMATDLVVQNLKFILQSIVDLGPAHYVRLVAVSKTFPAELVWLCYQHGQRHFGENYVQELEGKARELAMRNAAEIRWHYIGRIQSKMIRRLCAVSNLWCVETVDSLKHSNLLQSSLESVGRTNPLNIFIQVNTSGEQNKGGVRPEELIQLAKHIVEHCPSLNLMGIMTIGSISESMSGGEENADFALLRRLRDETEKELSRDLELSMGMSADYKLAIRFGSTNVRVGSSIFGHRNYGSKRKDSEEEKEQRLDIPHK